VLDGVTYPDVEFTVDGRAADSAREVFDGRRAEYATLARVARTLAPSRR
jgi:hypothetical protein